MAVAKDASMTGGNSSDGFNQEASSATSISSTGITVGGSATLLVAQIAWGGSFTTGPTGISMTWNGVAMTAGPTVTSSTAGTFVTVAIFYLINPAAGANTLAASWTNARDCYMSAISFTGTDTSTGIQVSDSTTATQTTSITVTSTTDGATVGLFCVDGSTPTVNFTKIWAEAPLAPGGGGNFTLGGTSNAHTFTGAGGTRQALAGVHILAGGGGDVTVTPTGFGMTASLGTPTLANSGIQISPTGFGLTASLGTPALQKSSTMTPTGFGLTASLGTPTVTTSGNVTVTPTGFGLTMSLGTMTTQSDVTLTGITGFGLTTSLGTPALQRSSTMTPTGFGLTASLGSPSIDTSGNVTALPVGFGLTASLGTPALQLSSTLAPTGFGLTMSLGSPTVSTGADWITPPSPHRLAFAHVNNSLAFIADDGTDMSTPFIFTAGATGPVTLSMAGSDGTAPDLSTATTVTFMMQNIATGVVKVNAVALTSPASDGTAVWTRLSTQVDVPGDYLGQATVVDSGGAKSYYPDGQGNGQFSGSSITILKAVGS